MGVNGIHVLFVVLLFSIVGLTYGRLCWRVTEDSNRRQADDDQPLHGISEQTKQRILAEMENKHRDFKQRQELQAENRALKSQVYQQKKKFSELSDVKQECDETIEQMKDKVTKAGEKNYVLILELSELDHRLDLERKHLEEKEMSLNETRTSLNETQVTLEETERELYEIQRTLRQTIEQEQKLRMDLIEDYKHLENRLKEEQNRRRAMEASLRRQLSQCQEELEQAKRSHKAAVDKCQSEKCALQEKINAEKKCQNKLEETLTRERQTYNTNMKAMQDQLTKYINENKEYRGALDHIRREKDSLMAEHKQLLGRFEAALKELDMYTGRLKCPNPGKCVTCKAGLDGKCTTENVEYELSCAFRDCQWSYSDRETRRPVRERIMEHHRAATNKDIRNPVGRHYANNHGHSQIPNIPFTVRITGRARDQGSDR